tara:strand:- start:7 stop:300 length:294 start_codon:yes stop_codon:yes gene_type:complete
MPRIIEVGDMVYKKGNYYSLDSDYGLVSEVVKDKYTGTKYLTVYWLYDAVSETIMEDEVSLYKKSVKAYGKFNKEGSMSVEDWLEGIRKLIKKPTKN